MLLYRHDTELTFIWHTHESAKIISSRIAQKEKKMRLSQYRSAKTPNAQYFPKTSQLRKMFAGASTKQRVPLHKG